MDDLDALTQSAALLRQQRYIRAIQQRPAIADGNGSVDRGIYLGLDASRQKGRVRLDSGATIDVEVLTTGDIMVGAAVLVRRSGGFASITGVPR